jgi:hypothetical protein
MNQNNQYVKDKNFDYDNELNKRLENRYKPSESLQPLFDFRPVSTKYTIMHAFDKPIQPVNQYKYDPHQIFNPGDRAPIDYFMKNVDVESTLRSQFFALQNSHQSVYVPELNSQLYENSMAYSELPYSFSLTDAKTNQCVEDSAEQLFYNCIRTNSRK